MKRLSAYGWWGLAFVVLASLFGFLRPKVEVEQNTSIDALPLALVDVVKAEAEQYEEVAFGSVESHHRLQLSFELPGRIAVRKVEVGSVVSKGELLASLEGKAYRNQRAAASAALASLSHQEEQLSREHLRFSELAASGALSKMSKERNRAWLDSIRAQQSAARAQLRERSRRLNETELRSPVEGVVVWRRKVTGFKK